MLLHFGYFSAIPSTALRNPLPTWSLPDSQQSWQAASISRFRTAAALSSSRRCAWWQAVRDTFFQPFRNFKTIFWQISSNGARMVIAKLMYHPQIAVSLVHCFSLTSLLSVGGYSVNIQQDRNIHTLQCHITLYKCHASATQQCTWKYFPRQCWVHI